MTRREMLNTCLSGCVSGSLLLTTGLLSAQQPGRATLQPRSGAGPRGTSTAQAQPEQAPRIERPPAGNMEPPLSKELEDLLVQWEEQSGKIQRLQGEFIRYVYDTVYLAETRAAGRFYYEQPDKGRMDFQPTELPDPPRQAANKRPYTLQTEVKQRWICTGTEIFVIDDDKELYDLILIPAHQQGRNIINGPLPFLFGMKAEQAKARYYLNLGEKHWPQGKVVVNEQGKEVRLAPQLHIIAAPKLEQDQKEWRRAEVLLTHQFLPRAIRLINTTGSKETAYIFFPGNKMTVNQRLWWLGNYPFNDKPPAHYHKASENRASDEETSVRAERVLPTAGQRLLKR